MSLTLAIILLVASAPVTNAAEEYSMWDPQQNIIVRTIAETYSRNTNNEGYIIIPIASICQPVMQGEDNEFYLRRNNYGEYDILGTPFFDYRCDVQNGRNIIVYGHSTPGMGLFGRLELFIKNNNYRNNYIYLYIDGEQRTYAVVSVFIYNQASSPE